MDSSDTQRRLFGTDGIRGVANVYPMTAEVAVSLGAALVRTIAPASRDGRPTVTIGRDTRQSGMMLESAITEGVLSAGGDVIRLGTLPSPAVARLTAELSADSGIVISASHNPYQDNGIKIFDARGYKLPDSQELQIENMILASDDRLADTAGSVTTHPDPGGSYLGRIKDTLPGGVSLEGLSVVLDCANGAAYKIAPEVLGELGALVHAIGVDPDGTNINRGCGAVFPENMCEVVRKLGADAGIALDGDADRVILCDERGTVVDGDKIMAICAGELLDRGELRHRTVVATTMSNMALEDYLAARDCRLVRAGVGDRYVMEEMIRGGFNFGGEKSGHIIFGDLATTGDGILTAVQVLGIMRKSGKGLADLSSVMTLYPQRLTSLRVRTKMPFERIEGLADVLSASEERLRGTGRINLRYSGTEPLARVMVEGKSESLIEDISREIERVLKKEIGE